MLGTKSKVGEDAMVNAQFCVSAAANVLEIGAPESSDVEKEIHGGQRPRILVADSDGSANRVVAATLPSNYYDLVFVNSPRELLNTFIDGSSFHAVLLELLNPVQESLDLLSFIKDKSPTTEVIMISWFAEEDLWIESIQRGAYDYLPKPLDRRELQRVMTNALERNRHEGRLVARA